MKWWLAMFLGVVAFVGGCVTVDPEAMRSQIAGKSLVIVTTLPDELSLSWVGTTFANNEFATVKNGAWTIPTWIEQRAVSLLRNAGDGRRVRALVIKPGSHAELLTLVDPEKEILLFIEAGYGPDKVFERPPFLKGVGVRQHSSFGFKPASATYVKLIGSLRDARSMKQLAYVSAESFQRLPFVALDKGPAMYSQWEPGVRDSVQSQIDTVVFELLSQLGLVGTVAPAMPLTPPPPSPGTRG